MIVVLAISNPLAAEGSRLRDTAVDISIEAVGNSVVIHIGIDGAWDAISIEIKDNGKARLCWGDSQKQTHDREDGNECCAKARHWIDSVIALSGLIGEWEIVTVLLDSPVNVRLGLEGSVEQSCSSE
jgi:hypothetical protein